MAKKDNKKSPLKGAEKNNAVDLAKAPPESLGDMGGLPPLHRLSKVEVTTLCKMLARQTCDDFFPSAMITLINHLYATWSNDPRGEIESEFMFVANEILRADSLVQEAATRGIADRQYRELRQIVSQQGGAQ